MDQESLDPENWDAMRALAHRMVDDGLDYLRDVRQRPVWRQVPEAVAARLQGPAPRAPLGAEAAYREFQEAVLPYPLGNIHPRFWGWYVGTGTPFAALADFMAAVMNPSVAGLSHAPNLVEGQVIAWMKDIVGLPATASGLLVSGGSMSNLVGLAVARNARAGFDVRERGLRGAPQLIVYASTEVHSSVHRAIELLGLGRSGLHRVAVRADFTLDIAALEAALAQDRAAGHRPICVIGTAGTVNTGAIDDLHALADLSAREGLWFHVDGAIGAIGALSPVVAPLLKGIERADSVALDLHKGLHVPFEAGCILVRDEAAHRGTFALTPAYLARETRGVAAGERWFSDYGPQLTRGFRALKVWLSVKEHGLERFGRMITRNVEQARRLAALTDAAADLERLAPVVLDIVCFRFNPGGLPEARLDALNKEILLQLHEQGIAVPSYTVLGGKYCLRVAIVNHRSTDADFELLVREVRRRGRELAAKAAAG